MKRKPKRLSFRVDRVFPSVGRINLVSGATTRAEHAKRDALLTELYDTGRLELLRAIKAHRLTINEVYSAQRAGRLGFVAADVALQRNLWKALDQWLPASGRAPATRRRHVISVRALLRSDTLSSSASVRDLAAVNWKVVYNRWDTGPAGWNRMRAAISLFLSMTLGKLHPFRLEVIGAMPHPEESPGPVPDLTVDAFWSIVRRVPEPLRPAYVLLAATGRRPGEYLRLQPVDLLPLTKAIRVPGTKTAGSADVVRVADALWPWVVAAVPCAVGYQVLLKRWKRACGTEGHPELTLYSLRHFFAQQLAEAGAPESRIQQSLRHRSPAMTRRYTRMVDKGENARVVGSVLAPPEHLQIVAGAASGD
jgi:integrase